MLSIIRQNCVRAGKKCIFKSSICSTFTRGVRTSSMASREIDEYKKKAKLAVRFHVYLPSILY